MTKKPAAAGFFLCPIKSLEMSGRKKTGPQAGFFLSADITSKQQEQPKQQEQQQRPKQLEQQPKRLEQQRQQQERLEQQLELEQRLQERLLELGQQELLLFSSKQPEQQPAGRRSAGIFSWVFLS